MGRFALQRRSQIMDELARAVSQQTLCRQTRRRFLLTLGQLAGLGSIGLLAACQSPPETIVVTPPPANAVRAQSTPTVAPVALAPTAQPAGVAAIAPTSVPVAPPLAVAPVAAQTSASSAPTAAGPTAAPT